MDCIIKGLCGSSETAAVFLQSVNYNITEIEEDPVPLAAGVTNQFYLPTILGMAAVLIVLVAVTYWIGCRRYRKRIQELEDGKQCYCGWNFWKLRETTNELELQKASYMIKEMQESFQKNLNEAEPFCS